jgi:outer membrane protein assembly factor BamB
MKNLLLTIFLLVITITGLALVNTAQSSAGDWPTFYGDVTHSGFNSGNAPNNNNTLWILSGVGGYQSIPVVDEGRVFAGSTDGKINAIDITSGKLLWSFQTTPHIDQPPRLTVAYGTVYACSYPERQVYSLNETNGSVLWTFQAKGVLGCSPTASNGTLFVPSQGGLFYALDAQSGAEKWTYPIGTSTAVPAVADGKVFIGDWSGFLAAIEVNTGQLIWATTLPGVVATSPTVSDGKVFVMQGSPSVLYALDEETGGRLWAFTPLNVPNNAGATAAVAYGKVYIAPTWTNQVFAIDEATGLLAWQSTPGPYNALKHYGALAVADNKIFAPIGSSLFALNATTGSTVWKCNIGGYYSQIEGQNTGGDCPALANGTVFIGAGDKLFAIDGNSNNAPPITTGNSSPTDTTSKPTMSTLTLFCTSTTSLIGFKVQISGNLSQDNTVISNAPILLSYSITGGATWIDLTLVNTDTNGGYIAVWTPAVTGNYQIKAKYLGNETMSGATTTVNLVATPYPEQNSQVFSVASNSTVSNLVFNSTSQELSFTVAGSTGTSGYVEACIAKSIINDPAYLKVFVDENQLNYTSMQTEESLIVYFVYHHSTHTVILGMGMPQPKPFQETTEGIIIIMAAAVVLIAFIGIALKRRNHNKSRST